MPEIDAPFDRDRVIRSFFQSLKVTFKMASMYNMEHPAFVSSVTDFQKKVEEVFALVSPVAMGFTPRSIYFDGRFWEGEKIYQELGRLFHFRKIKSLEIRPGLSPEEMFKFTSKITMPLKKVFQLGGPAKILEKEKIVHITIEELDYGQMLKGEGAEIADVWTYLMEEALDENDDEKLDQVTASFGHAIGKFNTDELVTNEELQKTFSRFFTRLKDTEEAKYRQCAKHLVKAVVGNRKMAHDAKFENLKLLVSGLQEHDLAETVWDQIIVDPRFDPLSFNVFAHLVEKDRHQKISTSLYDLFRGENPANRKSEVERKIKGLLSGRMSQLLPDVYRTTLGKLINEISFDQPMTFSHEALRKNYLYTLLNVFDWEKAPAEAGESLKRLDAEWNAVAEAKDFEFIRDLFLSLNKKEEILAGDELWKMNMARLAEFVENAILDGETDPLLGDFVEGMKAPVLSVQLYLERMSFTGSFSALALRYFFRFFKDYLFLLLEELEKLIRRPEVYEKAVASLATVSSPLSIVVLKKIYDLGSRDLKIAVLGAMRKIAETDVRFLAEILRTNDPEIQGLALGLLIRTEEGRREGFRVLFEIESPFGLRNTVLLRHIRIVEEREVRGAAEHLHALSQRKGIWNRGLRREAERVLEKWYARKR
jgi:hypothetical protein